jgi:thiol-disulfide isomerase/thioredoxin
MRMNAKRLIQICVVLLVVGAIVYIEVNKPHSSGTAQNVVVTYGTSTSPFAGGNEGSSTGASTNADNTTGAGGSPNIFGSNGVGTAPPESSAQNAARVQQEEEQYPRAKEITDPTGFINSPNGAASSTPNIPGSAPFTISQFAGNKVVLLDFWTYSCINCERTIPYLNAWNQKYKDYGLEIIGVHTPEFDFEKVYANVANAVKQFGILYPVVLDSNMGTWNAYDNQYWPADYLINVDGFVVHQGIGEGNYSDTEQAIQAALKERDQVLGLPDNVPTGLVNPSDAVTVDANDVQSPETYFGSARNEYLDNGTQGKVGSQTLTVPAGTTSTSTASLQADALYLTGTWNFNDQYAESTSQTSKIFYMYDAKNMYFVAAADTKVAPNGVKINIILDGVPQGTTIIQANRLYDLIQGTSYGEHTVEIDVEGPGLQAYTFTFG